MKCRKLHSEIDWADLGHGLFLGQQLLHHKEKRSSELKLGILL